MAKQLTPKAIKDRVAAQADDLQPVRKVLTGE